MQTNGIIKLEIEDYTKAYKDLEKFCIEHTHLLLFGEFGNASFPSISDLDVFICLKDGCFLEDRAKIIEYINQDQTKQYLFFHDPLILSESLLKYYLQFHTAYNLNFSYQEKSVFFSQRNVKQLELLNIIWATYLMGIGPEILLNDKFTIRDKLLVLKNICQSIVNLDPTSNALVINEETRKKAFCQKLTNEEVNKIFVKKLNDLYQNIQICEFNTQFTYVKRNYHIERNKVIVKGEENSFSTKDGKILITLNPDLFNFFCQFYYKKSSHPEVESYIKNARNIKKFCNQQKIKYPFVTPFSYHFYRNDFRFSISKMFNGIFNNIFLVNNKTINS